MVPTYKLRRCGLLIFLHVVYDVLSNLYDTGNDKGKPGNQTNIFAQTKLKKKWAAAFHQRTSFFQFCYCFSVNSLPFSAFLRVLVLPPSSFLINHVSTVSLMSLFQHLSCCIDCACGKQVPERKANVSFRNMIVLSIQNSYLLKCLAILMCGCLYNTNQKPQYCSDNLGYTMMTDTSQTLKSSTFRKHLGTKSTNLLITFVLLF